MIEDLTWFGIKWNQGPSSDDFNEDNNQNDSKTIKEFDDNKTVGKKQRKKMKKNENNPEQSETDFNNTNFVPSQYEIDDDKSLLRMGNFPQESQGTFLANNACQVRISSACTYVDNSNTIENGNENANDNKDENIDESATKIEENILSEQKDFLTLQLNKNENENENKNVNKSENENLMENSKEKNCNNNNENFLFTANLGLFQNVYCQSKRIPCYLAAWKFLLKKNLSKN